MRGEGRIFRRGAVFWIAYYVQGKEYREPGGRTERLAEKTLKARLAEKHGDRFIGPEQERVTVSELLADLQTHLELRGAKGVRTHRSHAKRVRSAFGDLRAVTLTTARIEAFIKTELDGGKARATVNREVAVLRQAFSLARKQARLVRVPYFPMLREDNARQGFFERAEFEALASKLPVPLADVARFAYLTGWRKGEILPLRWEAVDRPNDRKIGEIRLATSKSGHGRVIPLVNGELAALVERRWQARSYELEDGSTVISVWVFHDRGRPVGDFRKAWAAAGKAADVPERLFHDLRRTAIRNMIRAGVPQPVAMSISGHRTISTFLRYNITNNEDKCEAFRRTEAHLAGESTPPSNVEAIAGHGQNTDIPDKKTEGGPS